MWAVSDHYLATIGRPHANRVYLEILRDGLSMGAIRGAFTDPITGNPLYLVDGSVSVDKTAIRRSAQLTLLDPTGRLLPDSVADLLAPYITEVRPWVGCRYWDAPLPAMSTAVTGLGTPYSPVLQADEEYAP